MIYINRVHTTAEYSVSTCTGLANLILWREGLVRVHQSGREEGETNPLLLSIGSEFDNIVLPLFSSLKLLFVIASRSIIKIEQLPGLLVFLRIYRLNKINKGRS